MHEKFNKEIEIMRINKTKILEINTVIELKNTTVSTADLTKQKDQ